VTDPAADERILRDAVVRGDEGAWRILWDRYFDSIHAYVHWKLRQSPERVEELVQESWMIAVRSIRKFDASRCTFGTWLRGIANNVLRNELRKQERGPIGPLDDDAAIPSPSGPRSTEANETVSAVLRMLPEDYRDVLKAKYFDGLAVVEIAAASGRSVKAVESLLTRARDAFRRAWPQTRST